MHSNRTKELTKLRNMLPVESNEVYYVYASIVIAEVARNINLLFTPGGTFQCAPHH